MGGKDQEFHGKTPVFQTYFTKSGRAVAPVPPGSNTSEEKCVKLTYLLMWLESKNNKVIKILSYKYLRYLNSFLFCTRNGFHWSIQTNEVCYFNAFTLFFILILFWALKTHLWLIIMTPFSLLSLSTRRTIFLTFRSRSMNNRDMGSFFLISIFKQSHPHARNATTLSATA